jgi:hypothetical protein
MIDMDEANEAMVASMHFTGAELAKEWDAIDAKYAAIRAALAKERAAMKDAMLNIFFSGSSSIRKFSCLCNK